MKLLYNNQTYLPIYSTLEELYVEDCKQFMVLYQNSFRVNSMEFQSMFDCLQLQLIYWFRYCDNKIDILKYQKIIYELEGLDFYKFFYDDEDWTPFLIIDEYDGYNFYSKQISDSEFAIDEEKIEIKLDFGGTLVFTDFNYEKYQKCNFPEKFKELIELFKSKKYYLDEGDYFFIIEKNYNRLMLYMKEQVIFLNEAYKYLNLKEIEIS